MFDETLELEAEKDGWSSPQPVAGKKTALCMRCQQIKPQGDFEFYLTTLQARARGYSGDRQVLLDTGLLCKECRPKTRTLTRMTRNEIHNRVVEGRLAPALADRLIKHREEAALYKQRTGAEIRWAEEYAKRWKPTFDAITRELKSTEQAEKGVLKNVRAAERHGLEGDALYASLPMPGVKERLLFSAAYKTLLRALRDTIRIEYIRRPGMRRRPWHARWVDYIEELWPHRRTEMLDLWEAIPFKARVRLRVPAIVAPGGKDAQIDVVVPEMTEAQLRKQAVAGAIANEWLDPTGGHDVRKPPGRKPKPPPAPATITKAPPDKRPPVAVPSYLIFKSRTPQRVTPPAPTAPIPNDPWGDDDAAA